MSSISYILLVGVCLIALMYGLQTISSFENSTIGECTESTRTAYNGTNVTGSGSVSLILSSFLPGSGNLTPEYTGSGNVTVGGCTYPISAAVVIPKNCMDNILTVTYSGPNVTNTSMEYNSLENCNYLSDSYYAMKSNTTATYTLTTALTYVLYAVLGFSLIFILVKWLS